MSELSETPFRVYMVDAEGDPACIAACDEFSLGEALLDLRRQGRISVVSGIMYRPFDNEPGEWLINPFGPPSSLVDSAGPRGQQKEERDAGIA